MCMLSQWERGDSEILQIQANMDQLIVTKEVLMGVQNIQNYVRKRWSARIKNQVEV